LRPETPDLTIRLVLQDRVLTATTRRTLSDTALASGSTVHRPALPPPYNWPARRRWRNHEAVWGVRLARDGRDNAMVSRTIAPLQWDMILDAIHTGRCVPFLGAGVNASTPDYQGLPLGGEVAIRLVERLLGGEVPDPKKLVRLEPGPLRDQYQDLVRLRLHDLARVALHVQVSADQVYLMRLLREILPDQECRPSKLLDTLARLPLRLIVTTNYDRLMEAALQQNGQPEPLVIVQPLKGFSANEQLALQDALAGSDGLVLYKIHGSFDDQGGNARDGTQSSVIVSEEDYIEFLTVAAVKNAGVPSLISQQLVDSVLLFLGYGLEDWDFRTIYKVLVEELPARERRRSFAIQKDPSEFWTRYWASKNVEIFDVDLYEFAAELEQRYEASLGERHG
jgi:SIR2-like domain